MVEYLPCIFAVTIFRSCGLTDSLLYTTAFETEYFFSGSFPESPDLEKCLHRILVDPSVLLATIRGMRLLISIYHYTHQIPFRILVLLGAIERLTSVTKRAF
jgi:hypothetical protein